MLDKNIGNLCQLVALTVLILVDKIFAVLIWRNTNALFGVLFGSNRI